MWHNRFNLLTESREEIGRRFINTLIKENYGWRKKDLCTFLDEEFDNNVEDINWILKIILEEETWPSAVVVRVLVESGAELQVLNDLGQTALHIAAKKGCEYIVELLFEYSGDENHIDDEGFSYLHAACMYGLDEVVQRFINKGANINVKTFYKKRRNESPLTLCL
ncbi:hypothetical protein TKK_0011803 [Trichogramma kaykai]|uniref:Uncharacterized protein n=1 Tax=Trichogramma kaykai TaxID=54128 RepID=A0ABD2WPW1_9HYME